MTESRLGDPTAVRYLFKRALQANARSRYTHLAWAMWEREQVRSSTVAMAHSSSVAITADDRPTELAFAGL